ncbi:restriction endonuclease [Corynebacterium glutamicum]|uniref:restriction endonuclease n=1 Tax=Corynebacterium glutamicum TaxID=1718 RepID=UPI0009458925|nr:restriction endonuclease [Corynebacterium glutamicum]OKX81681.1 hypothetical protein AUO95_07820 [Corynebacterium glutamicum]
MSRVEWSTLSGEDVESVVALLLNRQHPAAVRITPSQGDGGVDILHRDGDGRGMAVVYQVKKFSTKLTSNQKSQIEKSLSTLLSDDRWKDLNLTIWRLVLPLDPLPEEELWFQGLLADKKIRGEWLGLSHVEQLAAKFPDVVDYYLHGHRERLAEKLKEMVTLLAPSQGVEGITAKDSIPRLQTAISALQNDPFYSFSISVGEGAPPSLDRRSVPNLVFCAGFAPVSGSGDWAIVDIVARSADSTKLSPISISGVFEARKGTKEASELDDFISFGIPFNSTDFTGELIAPGGFGGAITSGVASISTVATKSKDTPLRLGITSPEGIMLGEVDIDLVRSSQGVKGLHVSYEEVNRIFTIDLTMHYTDPESRTITSPYRQDVKFQLHLEVCIGKPVGLIEPIFAFLAECRPPNFGTIGDRYIWPSSASEVSFLALLNSDEKLGLEIQRSARWLHDLSVIQQHTTQTLIVPEFDKVTDSQMAHWSGVAKVLSGESAIYKLKPNSRIHLEYSEEAGEFDERFIKTPIKVWHFGEVIEVGMGYISFEDPTALVLETTETDMVLTVSDEGCEVRLSKEIPESQLLED